MSEEGGTSRVFSSAGVALLGAISGALLTIVGQPYAEKLYSESQLPTLTKAVRVPSLTSLPSSVAGKIDFVVTSYRIEHRSGKAAEDLSITVRTSEPLAKESFKLDPSSEVHKFVVLSDQQARIDVPKMRPRTHLAVEVAHPPDVKLQWSEVLSQGSVVSANRIAQASRTNWGTTILITAIFAVIVTSIVLVAYGLYRGVVRLANLEPGNEPAASERKVLLYIIAGVVGYNYVLRLGVLPRQLLPPSVPLSDVFYGLLIFLIVANFGMLARLSNRD